MARPGIPTWTFALTVVRKGDRFLLIHEKKHDQTWYFPGGRIEQGETIAEGAVRETLEESGVPVVLDGIVRIEHTPRPDGARLRVFFVAHPADDTPPKSSPDDESLGAAWVSLEELDRYGLRAPDLRATLTAVAAGATIHPLSLLTVEGRGLQP